MIYQFQITHSIIASFQSFFYCFSRNWITYLHWKSNYSDRFFQDIKAELYIQFDYLSLIIINNSLFCTKNLITTLINQNHNVLQIGLPRKTIHPDIYQIKDWNELPYILSDSTTFHKTVLFRDQVGRASRQHFIFNIVPCILSNELTFTLNDIIW